MEYGLDSKDGDYFWFAMTGFGRVKHEMEGSYDSR